MTRLMKSRELLLLDAHHHGGAFGPHQDFILGLLKIIHLHFALVFTCREQGRFVDQVG